MSQPLSDNLPNTSGTNYAPISPFLALKEKNGEKSPYSSHYLADAIKATVHLVGRDGKGDTILVSADRNPNVRGALVTGLIAGLPAQKLTALAAEIDAGRVATILSVGEDLVVAGLSAEQLAKVSVIYLGTHQNVTSEAAKVVIPSLTVFEKSGTLVNQQFRIQKFSKAVPGPAGVSDDLVTLSNLLAAIGGTALSSDLGALWATISGEVKPLATLTYANLPSTGLLLDGTPWAALPFVEGETLHFTPAASVAATTA